METDPNAPLRTALVEWMKRTDTNQRDVANSIGVSRSWVQFFLNGRGATYAQAVALQQLIGRCSYVPRNIGKMRAIEDAVRKADEKINAAVEIARDLARADPTYADGEIVCCALCGAVVVSGKTDDHLERCAYRRAIEFARWA